jgi:hypothetical protein
MKSKPIASPYGHRSPELLRDEQPWASNVASRICCIGGWRTRQWTALVRSGHETKDLVHKGAECGCRRPAPRAPVPCSMTRSTEHL